MSDETTSNASSTDLSPAAQRKAVRERYGAIASNSSEQSGESQSSSCCDSTADGCEDDSDHSQQLGYTEDDIAAVASGANLNLGCGNPTAIASLEPGETVLDLGSGGGFDCFLAANEVGPEGQVIGVDMTPAMIEKARENVVKNDVSNVEFRLGEIEHLPIADETVDVIISNCVINLSPDKPQVFREAHRVLQSGGRLAVSDVVMTTELPDNVQTDPTSVAACVGGASTVKDLERMLDEAGFVDVSIEPKDESEEFIEEWDDKLDLSEYIVSATIEGRKSVE